MTVINVLALREIYTLRGAPPRFTHLPPAPPRTTPATVDNADCQQRAVTFPAPTPSAPSTVIDVADQGRDVVDLFDLHAPGLYRLAAAMLHDGDAQDVVQDTFAKLIGDVAAGGILSNPRGWLYTVAR